MKKGILAIFCLVLALCLAACAPAVNTAGNTENAPAGAADTPELKSREEILALVFDHAQVQEKDVQDLDVDLEDAKSVVCYEVSFDVGANEYDYWVEAYTGKILKHNVETPEAPAESKPAESKPAQSSASASTTTKAPAKEKISAAKAKSVALSHAGIKESDARDLDVDLDTEKGKLVYEVSFDAGGYDYDYDIDAYTGKVLRSEKEKDD